MDGGRAVETSPLVLVFRMTSYYYVDRGSGQPVFSVCTHDGGCPKAAGPKHSHFKRGICVSSAIPHSIVYPWSSFPCWRTADSEVVSPSAKSTESLMRHNYIPLCTVYTVVQQSVLVDYRCFHLTSGASTANIVDWNRNRLLLSQSTLREKFAEKKYQVFDIS